MYLSSIPVETGSDPNRPRSGHTWVQNAYRIHQRLCMAFDGRGERRILFRVEGPILTRRGLRPRILVQSTLEPDWDAAFGNAPFLIIREDVKTKPYDPRFHIGETFRFLLRANPALKKNPPGKKNGIRLGIMDAGGQVEWLRRKADAAGFRLAGQPELRARGFQYARRSKTIVKTADAQTGEEKCELKDAPRQVHLAVTFCGVLQVTHATPFGAAIANGIGPAKAFGFGLLSVAPMP